MSVSLIEQAKIQAQVLVPLVKGLQAELRKEALQTTPDGSIFDTM